MNVQLRVVMKSAAVDVLLPRDRAMTIYNRWASKDYALKGEDILQGQDLYGFSYAMKVSEINALFVMPMPPNAPPPGGTQAPGTPPWPGAGRDRSGGN